MNNRNALLNSLDGKSIGLAFVISILPACQDSSETPSKSEPDQELSIPAEKHFAKEGLTTKEAFTAKVSTEPPGAHISWSGDIHDSSGEYCGRSPCLLSITPIGVIKINLRARLPGYHTQVIEYEDVDAIPSEIHLRLTEKK